MSIARLKELKRNRRYNSPLAFLPSGTDIKILVDAIEESQASATLDPIKNAGLYNGRFDMTLSGYEVKLLVESIACPSDNLKIIKNQLRYGTRHEYILTGKHIKILVDNIEDTSCLVPPAPTEYTIWYSYFIPATQNLIINAQSYGYGAAIGDSQGFADLMQTVNPNGGATGVNSYNIYISLPKLAAAPIDWLWIDFDTLAETVIVFDKGDDYTTLSCLRAVFTTTDAANDYPITLAGGYGTDELFVSQAWADPALEAALLTKVKKVFGLTATLTLTVVGNDIDMLISNIPAELNNISSLYIASSDGSGGAFVQEACV